MKASDAVALEDYFSGRASENVRTLALAGLGVIWVASGGQTINDALRGEWLTGVLFFTVSLGLDFAQYALAALGWRQFVQGLEAKDKQPGDEVGKPRDVVKRNDRLFNAKTVALVGAYVYLITLLVAKAAGY